MSDAIAPALTPDEWTHRRALSPFDDTEISARDGLFDMVGDAPGACLGDRIEAALALANDALPADSPYKITRDDVALVRDVAKAMAYYDRHGDGNRDPYLYALAAKLAALLPPE